MPLDPNILANLSAQLISRPPPAGSQNVGQGAQAGAQMTMEGAQQQVQAQLAGLAHRTAMEQLQAQAAEAQQRNVTAQMGIAERLIYGKMRNETLLQRQQEANQGREDVEGMKLSAPPGGLGSPNMKDLGVNERTDMIMGNLAQNYDKLPPAQQQAVDQWKQRRQAGQLSTDALGQATDMFAKTNEMPTGSGMGAAKARIQILNNYAEGLASGKYDYGQTLEAGATLKGNRGALAQLTKDQVGVETFADFTEKNFGLLRSTMQELQNHLGDLNQPKLYNQALLGLKGWENDPYVAAYRNQLLATKQDLANVLTSAKLSGQRIPVTSLEDWDKAIPESTSPAAMDKILERSATEVQNRRDSFNEQVQKLTGRIHKAGSNTTESTPPSPNSLPPPPGQLSAGGADPMQSAYQNYLKRFNSGNQ